MCERMEIDVGLNKIANRQFSRRGFVAMAGVSMLPMTLAACAQGSSSGFPSQTIRIMVPADKGGGWDITGRAIQRALKDAKLVNQSVEVYNVTGSAGINGLAELISKHSGEVHELMVMGLVMVGGIVSNKSKVGLSDSTPIATLTAENEVIVVPDKSEFKTLDDIMEACKSNPKSVNWGGGSAGGTDQILIGLLADAAGVDAAIVANKYTPYSGGGESLVPLVNGDIQVGVSGISEYAGLIKDGQVRPLAVSGPKAIDVGDGKQTSTLKQLGYDVELMNWRGVVAPPGISEGDRDAIVTLMKKLHDSQEWQEICDKNGWDDFYKSGSKAGEFFKDETARVTKLFKETGMAK